MGLAADTATAIAQDSPIIIKDFFMSVVVLANYSVVNKGAGHDKSVMGDSFGEQISCGAALLV